MQGMSTDAHFDRFGLNETGPTSQNLAVDDQHLDSLQPYIGMTLDYPLNLNTAHPANLQARLGYAYDTLDARSEEHTSELQSLMRISYAVFCSNKNIRTPVEFSTSLATRQVSSTPITNL